MKKIMILGSAGMLGHVVYNYFALNKDFKILDTSFPVKANENSYVLNVTNKVAVEKYIKDENPDIVINCIGVLIKDSKKDPSNAIYLNAFFPHYLSKILRETGGKLIHISTDCVFSGNKGEYTEMDFRDADDIYGRSKALGELINDYDLTLRTSIIGPELKENGEGLFHWMMRQSGEIKGFTQVFWSGVTTLELAKVIEASIHHKITGIAHVTNGIKISKFALLSLVQEIWRTSWISLKPIDGKHSDKSMVCGRKDMKYLVPTYKEMLLDLYKYMDANRSLYQKYFLPTLL